MLFYSLTLNLSLSLCLPLETKMYTYDFINNKTDYNVAASYAVAKQFQLTPLPHAKQHQTQH